MTPSKKLAELGLALPQMSAPIGSYIPALRTGRYVFTSGQLPMRNGKLVAAGKVPEAVAQEEASEGAGIAALNGLGAVAHLIGDIDLISQIVRVCVYVNSSPGFTAQPAVANGASDLLVKIFADAGRHARSAVGVAELPMNAPVEVELLVEVEN